MQPITMAKLSGQNRTSGIPMTSQACFHPYRRSNRIHIRNQTIA